MKNSDKPPVLELKWDIGRSILQKQLIQREISTLQVLVNFKYELIGEEPNDCRERYR